MLLLDGEIEAAAGAVVGAQNQHHIFVADSAAQGFFVTHQCHGMDTAKTLFARVILIRKMSENFIEVQQHMYSRQYTKGLDQHSWSA